MNDLIFPALFGLLGGLIRAAVGITKAFRLNKKTKLKINYLIMTLILSGILGLITSIAFSSNYFINLIIGYAGIDFIDNMIKITKKKN
jgi:hypothetical protein